MRRDSIDSNRLQCSHGSLDRPGSLTCTTSRTRKSTSSASFAATSSLAFTPTDSPICCTIRDGGVRYFGTPPKHTLMLAAEIVVADAMDVKQKTYGRNNVPNSAFSLQRAAKLSTTNSTFIDQRAHCDGAGTKGRNKPEKKCLPRVSHEEAFAVVVIFMFFGEGLTPISVTRTTDRTASFFALVGSISVEHLSTGNPLYYLALVPPTYRRWLARI